MGQGYSIAPCLTIGAPLGRRVLPGYRNGMHTISSLRKALGLTTTNQVRNRIEAVRDVLEPHLRRGPNNQILLSDDGFAVLRQVQELYDSGLTMTEASDVIRATTLYQRPITDTVLPGFAHTQTTPSEGGGTLVRILQDEIRFLRNRLAGLEGNLTRSATPLLDTGEPPWWAPLREDLDVA
ncbi:MAG: hypothetical protein WCQ45_02425 [bacterium]